MFRTVSGDRYAVDRKFLVSASAAKQEQALVFAALPSHGFVGVWAESQFGQSAAKGQLFDLNGHKVGGEFVFGPGGIEPTVTGLGGGGFVVAWVIEVPNNGFDVHAQMFSAAGAAVGSEFVVNTKTTGFQIEPSATALAGGGFVISWGNPDDPLYDDARAQVFDAAGAKVGTEFVLTESRPGDKYVSHVEALAGGGFVASWYSFAAETDQNGNLSQGMRAQLFDSLGNKVGDPFSLNPTIPGDQRLGTVAALPNGGFVAAWNDDGEQGQHTGVYTGNQGLWLQIFDANGNRVGQAIHSSVYGAYVQNVPAIAVGADGFMMTWQVGTDAPNSGPPLLHAQKFDFNGVKIGEEFVVNPGSTDQQFTPTEVALSNGAYVLGWTEYPNPSNGTEPDVEARMIFPVVHGTSGNDSFTGTDGRDFYMGDAGNDSANGGADDDGLAGGDGDDLLIGGGGSDDLDGGAGNDVLAVSGIGHVTAAGGGDFDRLVIDWSAASGGIVSGPLSGTAAFGYSGSIGDGGSRSVDFTGIESFDITTGSGNDVVRTGGGDDILHLGSGNDTADGGAGTDGIAVDLSSAAAPVVWNLATNSYSGPVGSFTNFEYFLSLTSGAGDDRITTSTQALDDLVYGGAGADIITVYSGHDAVDGGLDSDLLVIDYSAATAAVTVSGFQPGTGGGAGWQGLVSDGGSHGVFFDNIERLDLTTGSGDDFVSGASGDDSIRTGLGTDTLLGGAGNDLLDGGAGADQMIGGLGNDIFYVDNVGDVVTENAGEGTADEVRTALSGYALADNVEILTWTGAGGGDLRGNAADNVLNGGTGADFVRAQDGGNDVVNLGGGNDAVYFGSAYTAADSVDGGSGADQVALQGDYSGGVTLGTLAGVETLVAMTGSDTRFGAPGTSLYSYNIVAPDSTVAAGTQLLLNASTLQAGENLTFDGSAETNGSFFIYGGKGVDTLTGGSGADVFFFAEDGRFAATDHIDGGAGQDVMVLRGNYSLTLSGTSIVNVETVVLNSGSDARFYAAGTPFSYDITTADDTVAAGQTMTFNGGQLAANELLHFDGSAETNGNFRLFGGSANDVIKGGAGNDLIYGGLGGDVLTGGAGADVFWLKSAAESSSTHYDSLIGFDYTVDRIDLPFTVSGAAEHGMVGTINLATFDADMARIVDQDLNPYGLIEVTTDANSDIGGHVFLVVDADGDGAYQADHDYVIDVTHSVVPPDPTFFI
jgi:Ca2+-binding RTX toxin-like protein